MTDEDNTDFALKSRLERAVLSDDPDTVATLSKNEQIFYICNKLGIDYPAESPDAHNGNVTADLLEELAQHIAEAQDGEDE